MHVHLNYKQIAENLDYIFYKKAASIKVTEKCRSSDFPCALIKVMIRAYNNCTSFGKVRRANFKSKNKLASGLRKKKEECFRSQN